jgi:hypothetical protein
VTSTSNGVHRSCFLLVFKKDFFKVFDSLFGMKAMEVNIELGAGGVVFIALFVKLTGSLSMGFSHRIVLALTTKTQGFCSSCIVAIPGLSGTI